MKKIIFVIVALVVATPAFAGSLVRDGEGQKIQAPAWDATLSRLITSKASQNFPISGMLYYEFTARGTCQGRLMNTTTRASWPAFRIYSATTFRGSNDAVATKAKAAFLNLSGCTGDFRGQ